MQLYRPGRLLLFQAECPPEAVSTLLQMLLVYLFSVTGSEGKTLLKILVDGGLFIASYFIQKNWVFAKKK